MKKWHKVVFGVAAALALLSWGIALYYWDKLPGVIPTHFGVRMPGLQTLMLAAFIFLYYKPQYSDMPTTLWLMTMEEHKRNHAFDLIRTMLVGISLWIGLLFAYITYGMNVSAMESDLGLNPWLLLSIIGLMLGWLVWWTIKVYRATKFCSSPLFCNRFLGFYFYCFYDNCLPRNLVGGQHQSGFATVCSFFVYHALLCRFINGLHSTSQYLFGFFATIHDVFSYSFYLCTKIRLCNTITFTSGSILFHRLDSGFDDWH
jgi:hypothetical protein